MDQSESYRKALQSHASFGFGDTFSRKGLWCDIVLLEESLLKQALTKFGCAPTPMDFVSFSAEFPFRNFSCAFDKFSASPKMFIS